jgi:hypothetical protein
MTDLRADDSSETTPGVPDGVVDQFDYAFWKANFGNTLTMGAGGQSSFSAVAESEGQTTFVKMGTDPAALVVSKAGGQSPFSAAVETGRQSVLTKMGTDPILFGTRFAPCRQGNLSRIVRLAPGAESAHNLRHGSQETEATKNPGA